MRICPEARLGDGLLDLTLIRRLSLAELVASLPMLYNGTIGKHRKVECYRLQHIKVESAEPVRAEIDGEPLGGLPIQISICPQAIRVLADE
jgi:diacylglycerol kinase (ATP)